MTTIETRCDRCGPVETTPRRVALRLGGHAASYRFRCPSCHRLVRRSVDDDTVLLLVRAGVRMRGLARLRWGWSRTGAMAGAATFASGQARPTSALRFRTQPPAAIDAGPLPGPITWDDVVEFALRLGVEPTPAATVMTEVGAPVGVTLAGRPA